MSDPLPEPFASRYEEIAQGMKAQREYVISPEVYTHFLGAFDDRSPVHVDDAWARARGFPAKVMHGAILNGFLSHFVGMHFPGRFSLLLATDVRFAQPCHLGDVIRIDASVTQKLDARRVVVLDMVFNNVTRSSVAARGRAQVMLRDGP